MLAELDEIEVTLLDDPAIAAVHERFMAIPGATDVITFQHGEILVSLDTAAAQARELGHSLYHEVVVCAIHGMLHLHGHDDKDANARARMHARQDELARRALLEGAGD